MFDFLEQLALVVLELLELPLDRCTRLSLGCLIGSILSFGLVLFGIIALSYFIVRLTVS
jgi:hypothetical protein